MKHDRAHHKRLAEAFHAMTQANPPRFPFKLTARKVMDVILSYASLSFACGYHTAENDAGRFTRDRKPIPMLLFCPVCGHQHVDRPNPVMSWTNPPHRSHLCAACGTVWRPCDVPTEGVLNLRTLSERDTWDVSYNNGVRALPIYEEYRWARHVIAAEMGYDGPMQEACSPLRDWLQELNRLRLRGYLNPHVAMEWGFKAHERGDNLEMAREKFTKEVS